MKLYTTAKNLTTALTIVRKGAIVVTDTVKDGYVSTTWTEKNEHKFGFDHVLIRVAGGVVTLYSTNGLSYDQMGNKKAYAARQKGIEQFECATSTFVPLDCRAEADGSFAVPVRTLHDYAKTFAPSDILTIALVDGRLLITQGRNRASIVGKTIEEMPFHFDGVQTVQAAPAPVKVSYNMSDATGCALAARQDAPAPAMHGPAYVPKPRVRYTWPKIAESVEEPAQRVSAAPTPIYEPKVGDSVFIVLRHENGTTTDRVVDVQRVKVENGRVVLFRGYDRRRNRCRNYGVADCIVMRPWDGEPVYDMNGRVVVEARAA